MKNGMLEGAEDVGYKRIIVQACIVVVRASSAFITFLFKFMNRKNMATKANGASTRMYNFGKSNY